MDRFDKAIVIVIAVSIGCLVVGWISGLVGAAKYAQRVPGRLDAPVPAVEQPVAEAPAPPPVVAPLQKPHRFPEYGTGNAFGLCIDGSGSTLHIIGVYKHPECRVFVATRDATYWVELNDDTLHALVAMLRREGIRVESNEPVVADPGITIGGPAVTTDDILERAFKEPEQE